MLYCVVGGRPRRPAGHQNSGNTQLSDRQRPLHPIHNIPEQPDDQAALHPDIVGQVLPTEFGLVDLRQGGPCLVEALCVVVAEAAQPEHNDLQQVAQQHRDEIQDQHQQGLVFVGQQNAVAAALDALERVVPHRAGGRTADVAAFGRGAVDIFVAEAVGAPAQVHIFVIGKEQLVKNADLVQDGFAVECCAAAGAENAAGLCVAAGPQTIAALAGKAQKRHIIARIIGQLRLIVAQILQ